MSENVKNEVVKEKKDKKKVLGETFTEDMLEAYASYEPKSSTQKDFDILLRAYRGLPEEAFSRFLKLFKQKGLNIDAENNEGVRFIEVIKEFPSFSNYVKILEAEGAKTEG